MITGRDVEARLQHHRHLVPGLVHLPAVDALQREHVEDDRGEVDRHLARRDPEQGDRGRRAPSPAAGRGAPRPGRTSRARRRSPRSSRARAGSRRSPSSVGSTAAVAPICSASSRRYGFGSVTTTWRAPAWRATATAMQPIGPAPVTSTSSPSTGNVSAVWTALPNGSKIAATSSSTPGPVVPDVGHRQRDVLGERARPLHAEPDRVRAEVPPAGHAVAAAAADDVPLAADDVARVEVAHVRADLDDLADELVPDHERHRDRLLRPGVPRVDVQVGAADAGLAHADQDVVDPDLRLGHVLEPEPRLGLRFDERFHVSVSDRRSVGTDRRPCSTRSIATSSGQRAKTPVRIARVIALLGGLGAAAFWAAATLCSSRSTKMIGTASALAWVMIVGLVVTAPLTVKGGFPPLSAQQSSAGWLSRGWATSSACSSSTVRCGSARSRSSHRSPRRRERSRRYSQSRRGRRSVFPPGVMLLVIAGGVALASVAPGRWFRRSAAAALLAISAALSFGAGIYATGRLSEALPLVWALVPARVIGVVAIALPLAATAPPAPHALRVPARDRRRAVRGRRRRLVRRRRPRQHRDQRRSRITVRGARGARGVRPVPRADHPTPARRRWAIAVGVAVLTALQA